MNAPPPLTREERDRLIDRYEALLERLDGPEVSDDEWDALKADKERVKQEYFDRLPRFAMTRCPFCMEVFVHSIDPWGIEGYWWQEDELVRTNEPYGCEHYTVLQGALSLQGIPPRGGIREEARVGPAVPFVIPRLLERSDTIAVIASLRLTCGYVAYPIVYFAKGGCTPEGLTNPWRRTSINWTTPDGRPAWSISADPWEFDLEPWVRAGRVLWMPPEDPGGSIRGPRDERCPYLALQGAREQQVILGDRLRLAGTPTGEDLEPFSE